MRTGDQKVRNNHIKRKVTFASNLITYRKYFDRHCGPRPQLNILCRPAACYSTVYSDCSEQLSILEYYMCKKANNQIVY